MTQQDLGYRTVANFQQHKDKGQVFKKPSLTVPDQSLSVAQIMKRYASGLSTTDSNRIPVYDGEEWVPDTKTMDLAEIQELRERNAADIQELRAKANANAKAAADKVRKQAQLPYKDSQNPGENPSRSQKSQNVDNEQNEK